MNAIDRSARRWIAACLFAAAVLLVPGILKRATGGFQVEKLRLDLPFDARWETGGAVSEEVRKVLSQPFSYLGRGTQSYVFASRDGKHVIKFFRFDKRDKKRFQTHRRFEERKKIERLFEACKLAYEKAPEETGLVFLHLNPTSDSLPPFECRDALGRKRRIDLDQVRFAIQKRVEPFCDSLRRAARDPAALEQAIDAVFDLLSKRSAKCIHNSDPNLTRNVGFLEGRALEIDFGNYRDCYDFTTPEGRIGEFRKPYQALRSFLEREAPASLPYLEARMKALEQEAS